MFSPIMHALSSGFSSAQVLKHIARKFPQFANTIHAASAAGFTADMILKKLSGKKGKEKKAEDFMTPHERTVRNMQKTKDADKMRVLGALGTAGAVGAGLYGISQMGKGVRPSQILPAQASQRGPAQVPGMARPRMGLPAPGQAAGAPQTPIQPLPASPQAPITPQPMPSATPTPGPALGGLSPQQAPKKASQVLNQVSIHGAPLGALVNQIISTPNRSGKQQTAQDVADVIEHTFLSPAQKKWLKQNSDKPLDELIEEYLQEQPEQEQGQGMEEQPMQAAPPPMPMQEPQMNQGMTPISQQKSTPEMPVLKPKIAEKVQSASFGASAPPKLSNKKLKQESFAIPTYKFHDETPKEFHNRRVINEAIEKAAKTIAKGDTFLDVPGFDWDPRGKMHYSVSSEILKYLAGIPNPVNQLLDDEEHEELNAALREAGLGDVMMQATPMGDPNIYGAQLGKDMVWNMLLAVEPRLQKIDKPKTVKGIPGKKMGTTELRRTLTHAVYGVLSGKRITNNLVEKIGKISVVANSMDVLAEALRQGKINESLKISEEIQKLSHNDFWDLVDRELESRGKEEGVDYSNISFKG